MEIGTNPRQETYVVKIIQNDEYRISPRALEGACGNQEARS